MKLNDFAVATPRPLPVFVLADTSGSMSGAKIQSLNAALRDMVAALQQIDDVRGQIQLAILTFGKTVECLQPLHSVRDIVLPEWTSGGKTPMGQAFALLRSMLEDETVLPPRAFSPTLVLVSDGLPTDILQSSA